MKFANFVLRTLDILSWLVAIVFILIGLLYKDEFNLLSGGILLGICFVSRVLNVVEEIQAKVNYLYNAKKIKLMEEFSNNLNKLVQAITPLQSSSCEGNCKCAKEADVKSVAKKSKEKPIKVKEEPVKRRGRPKKQK